MGLLREVSLPSGISGKLYLSSMPGRYKPLAETVLEVVDRKVTQIICLAPKEEIDCKSPEYAVAIENNQLPCAIRHFPIPDYEVPEYQDLLREARQTAAELGQGMAVLVHCAAGIGRTGFFACATLMFSELCLTEALVKVEDAGSAPETDVQKLMLQELDEELWGKD